MTPSLYKPSNSLPSKISEWPVVDVSRFYDVDSTSSLDLYSKALSAFQPKPISGADLLASWTDLSVSGSIMQDLYKRLGVTEHWVLDNHFSRFIDIEESASDISGAIAILENETLYPTSNSRVQAIKAELRLRGGMVKSLYYSILRDLKAVLSAEDFNKLRRELAGQIESMHNIFSRMTKKMKSVARLVSSTGFAMDRRQEHRKKLKIILRQSDEEDQSDNKVIRETFNQPGVNK